MGARGSKSKDNAVVDDPHRQPPVDRMTETQLHEFKEAFSQFDADRSGFIDAHELKNLCQWVGQDATEEEIQIMLDTADSDGSGKIDFWEFATLMAHKMGDANPDRTLLSAFSIFDGDGTGYIDASEIRHVMREMGEPVEDEDIDNVLKGMDSSGDGKIDYEEFATVVTKEMKRGGYCLV